jgi:hypothetical protein
LNTDELRRLNTGPLADEKPGGAGLERFLAHRAGDAAEVLARCKEVMRIVLTQDVERWPTDEEWKFLLPDWFVAACADEDTVRQKTQRWFELSEEERAAATASDVWSVEAFVYWFLPEERQWFWWDASILDANTVEILVQVLGDPYPWGTLWWLSIASGAIRVDRDW